MNEHTEPTCEHEEERDQLEAMLDMLARLRTLANDDPVQMLLLMLVQGDDGGANTDKIMLHLVQDAARQMAKVNNVRTVQRRRDALIKDFPIMAQYIKPGSGDRIKRDGGTW